MDDLVNFGAKVVSDTSIAGSVSDNDAFRHCKPSRLRTAPVIVSFGKEKKNIETVFKY